jgi:hypothetical protein
LDPSQGFDSRRLHDNEIYSIACNVFFVCCQPVVTGGLSRDEFERQAIGAGAKGVGYALHAIGDAACPQHTISAAGWGHAIYEGYAQDFWEGSDGLAARGVSGSAAQVPA